MKLIITTPFFDPRYLSRGHIHCECTRCGVRAPLASFGVRLMPDGSYRNQPQCRKCRAATRWKTSKRAAKKVTKP